MMDSKAIDAHTFHDRFSLLLREFLRAWVESPLLAAPRHHDPLAGGEEAAQGEQRLADQTRAEEAARAEQQQAEQTRAPGAARAQRQALTEQIGEHEEDINLASEDQRIEIVTATVTRKMAEGLDEGQDALHRLRQAGEGLAMDPAQASRWPQVRQGTSIYP